MFKPAKCMNFLLIYHREKMNALQANIDKAYRAGELMCVKNACYFALNISFLLLSFSTIDFAV